MTTMQVKVFTLMWDLFDGASIVVGVFPSFHKAQRKAESSMPSSALPVEWKVFRDPETEQEAAGYAPAVNGGQFVIDSFTLKVPKGS